MTLAVDIGNTNIVIGGFVQNEFQFIERISTNRHTSNGILLSLHKDIAVESITFKSFSNIS